MGQARHRRSIRRAAQRRHGSAAGSTPSNASRPPRVQCTPAQSPAGCLRGQALVGRGGRFGLGRGRPQHVPPSPAPSFGSRPHSRRRSMAPRGALRWVVVSGGPPRIGCGHGCHGRRIAAVGAPLGRRLHGGGCVVRHGECRPPRGHGAATMPRALVRRRSTDPRVVPIHGGQSRRSRF